MVKSRSSNNASMAKVTFKGGESLCIRVQGGQSLETVGPVCVWKSIVRAKGRGMLHSFFLTTL